MSPLPQAPEGRACCVADISDAYRTHRAEVLRFLLARTRDHQRAADLTQDVFVDALRALPQLERRSESLLPWLLTVARRRLVDDRRSRAAEPTWTPLDDAAGLAYDREEGATDASELLRAVRRLPESQRAVVLLRAIAGRSFAEIGAARAMHPSACRMQYCRAVRALRH